MTLDLVTIPCRQDNYAFLVHDAASGATALVDAPEAAPIETELARRGWRLSDILITHHHGDHVEAVEALRPGARVIGAAADAHRLPPLDLSVAEGDPLTVCGEAVTVLDVSGHTVGHLAFHFPASGIVFTADSLMALGCGRLFEGTATQMWESLQKLAALPPETLVCSGHEYTASNARFALTIEPDNPKLISRADAIDAARAEGRPTVPSTLKEELETNPFLRADALPVRTGVGMGDAPAAEVFAEVRARKDRF
ncbi:hydroxyacylglutathione hydrolase [Histidinibacterium lentulum]|uniref:Hydroxyacylglutathione hydrolase n=1 Tax=Histidinibacterium lentulum TaxID=2480588 RepID=A0A3N2R7X6_9RHOB|nr:hydroxyacylglutathione hydrolase [Histidinibacterium lentulum]ROU03537.1 hydroxyacylglutathione hydrolase [Histidinibacterium lentulum]